MNKEPTFRASTTTRSSEVVLPRGHKNTTPPNPGNKPTDNEHAGVLRVSTDDGYTDPRFVRSSNPKDRASSRNENPSRPGGTSQAAFSRNIDSICWCWWRLIRLVLGLYV
ncbi:hypothetical protein M407DRAFT_34436 [Tulasnella calospora MUT 4182]|uniref:Uncharacterized protein n=1 Tax=Tulasnella calospora MUT 4182 TaxID=1051891 RepID=A0A0C3K3G4_9AGAM|nr:hypothetical protein M407DRAFT_34436 [Tulasnella calospora MUT 4182]